VVKLAAVVVHVHAVSGVSVGPSSIWVTVYFVVRVIGDVTLKAVYVAI
jgi:hypothetical protein